MEKQTAPINGFSKYLVTSDGEVVSAKTGRKLKGYLLKSGYRIVLLCNGKDRAVKYVHRIVAEAFIDNPNEKREVDHINRNRSDNRVENLRWVSHKENHMNPSTVAYRRSESFVKQASERMKNAWIKKQWKCGRQKKRVLCVTTGKQYESTIQASVETGAKQPNISLCCRGKISQTRGLKFSFI